MRYRIAFQTHQAKPKTGKDIFVKVHTQIQKQFALRKSLQDYADENNIHPNHLARLFKKQLNMTFLDYVTQVRMEEAKKLLLTTSFSIADIALQIGYEDARYFSQIFRRSYQFTPSQYRESMGK